MKPNQDLQAGIFLLIGSLVVFFGLIPIAVEESSLSSMSPRFFPRFAAAITAMLSMCLILTSIIKHRREGTAPHQTIGLRHITFLTVRPLIVVVILAAYFLEFEQVGFLWATPPSLAALMLIYGERSPKVIILTCGIATTVLFFMFEKGLNVPLR